MGENAVKKLRQIGQSIWYDNITRGMIQSGELRRLIEEDGITGVTSNPTIFQKAISGSSDYDASIQEMIRMQMRDEKEIFLRLAMDDITKAADLLLPVYQESQGLDGYVSIEVSPDLAYDADRTVAEAKQIFSSIGRKNILIKVPGTLPGIPAIEELTHEGVNVNVTLLFSIARYGEIAEAYIRGLERRVKEAKPIAEIASVASFFVSRVDSMIDPILEKKLASAGSEAERQKLKSLMGKAAVANAKLAYQRYREIFWGKRFQGLKGARVQRILWGSTGTKNPGYSDIKYVEELIGPDSINTVPETTFRAFLDHGKARVTVTEGLKEAKAVFESLREVGIDIDQVTAQLEEEGVRSFSASFASLLEGIRQKIGR